MVSRPNEMIGRTEVLTVIVATFDVIAPLVAVIVVVPIAIPVMTPLRFTVAMPGAADAKVNVPPGGSAKPFASSRRGLATEMPAGAMVAALSRRSMAVMTCCTLSAALPTTPCAPARMAVNPLARARARTVCVRIESSWATDGFDEIQAKSMPAITTLIVSYATAR